MSFVRLATDQSSHAAISADGMHMSFTSFASNLVAGDTNGQPDVFIHNRVTGVTELASVAPDGSQFREFTQFSALSSDGRYVAFEMGRKAFHRDRQTGQTTLVAEALTFSRLGAPDIDGSGRHVAFGSTRPYVRGDVNGFSDVYVHDFQGVPGPTPPLVAIGDARVYEGEAGTRTAVFTVSLYEPLATTVTVNYATADSTATAGTDYAAQSGTLSFAPGTVSKFVKVPVIADNTDEPNEAFLVNLSRASGANVADASGRGTVTDDDPPATTGRRMSIGDVGVYEGDAGSREAVFSVTLSSPAQSVITVNYTTVDQGAKAPGDYLAKSGTLTFAPGTTALSVKVPVNGDTAFEVSPGDNETFHVVLSAISGPKTAIANSTGIGFIFGDLD